MTSQGIVPVSKPLGRPKTPEEKESDFEHRQKIAQCCAMKGQLRMVTIIHALLLVLIFFKVLDFTLRCIGLDQDWFTEMEFPSPNVWEFMYVCSIFPIFLATKAMPDNNDRMMIKSYYATFFCSIIPLVIGAGHQLPDVFAWLADREHAIDIMPMFSLTIPLCAVWYMYFIVALQVHALHMYLAYHMVLIWAPLTVYERKKMQLKGE